MYIYIIKYLARDSPAAVPQPLEEVVAALEPTLVHRRARLPGPPGQRHLPCVSCGFNQGKVHLYREK